MYEIKNSITVYVPVRFFDQSGVPISGIAFNTVSATVLHADGTAAIVTPASGGSAPSADWVEVTFGDFTGAGVYLLKVTGVNAAVNGFLSYAVSTSVVGAKKHVGVINIVANLEADTFTRLGAPAGASVSADIATLNTQSASILTRIGTPAGASVSADVAAVKSELDTVNTTTSGTSTTASAINTKLGTPAGASVSADIAAVSAKLGSPAGASVSADLAAVKSELDTVNTATGTINTKVGTPAGASVSADIAAVKGDTSSALTGVTALQSAVSNIASDVTVVKADTATIKSVELGKWVIYSTGPDANRQVFYDSLNNVIIKFNLFGPDGVTPTSENPYYRVPVP
jgi:hypothetical protein